MNHLKNFLVLFFILSAGILSFQNAFCQTNTFPSTGAAGIGTATPNTSSLLDVTSTSKGVLVPRMTKAQRDAITTPAQGLLIYQTNSSSGFYYYDGSGWNAVTPKNFANKSLSNLSAPTSVNAELLPGVNNSLNLGSASLGWKDLYLNGSVYIGALRFLNVNGYNNAIGSLALYNNTDGYANTAVGYNAMYTNTTGSQNTAAGYQALYLNSTGYDNTAIGLDALYANSTGYYNTASGYEALLSNTVGYENTASGFYSLKSNSSGNLNTAAGDYSLYSNTTGTGNTATGYFALYTNVSGGDNTALGNDANTNGNFSNSSAIGGFSLVTASNQVRIGNSSVSSIGGYVNWSNISDGRFKKNIKMDVKGLEFINSLQPITYTLDIHGMNNFLRRNMPEVNVADARLPARSGTEGNDETGQGKIIEQPKEDEDGIAAKEKIVYSGFIAQDVEKAAKEVGYDFSGVDAPKNDHDVYGLRYAEFVVPLVKAVQELSSKNDAKDKTIKSLQTAVGSLQKEVVDLKSEMNDGFAKLQTNVTPGKVEVLNSKPETILGQNIPNPFDNSTLIPFRIPKDCHDASIMITNSSTSQVISVIPISCNEDHVSIDAGVLASGTYSYSLYVDGTLIQTKQMAIVR